MDAVAVELISSEGTSGKGHMRISAEWRFRRFVSAGLSSMAARDPWFHHWFSKPLSTVIMAADRAPNSLALPVSTSLDRSGCALGSGENTDTIVGHVAYGKLDSCSWGARTDLVDMSSSPPSWLGSGIYSNGHDHADHGMPPSPSRNWEGSAGNAFHGSGCGRESADGSAPPAGSWETLTSHGFSPIGGGADWPRS